MKKLLLFAFAACALAACSDDDGDSRVPATAVVLDCTEKELAVGETLQLTATPAPANTTDDVVWSSDAEEFATVSESGLVTAVAAGTAKISATYGSVSATCTVHVSEPDPTATSVNYANQFMVWADKGANGSSNCMIGYFDGYTSGYATPMIEFVEPRQVSYLYMANSAITYPYKPTQVDEASYYYKVKITGSLEGKETGSAECFLINGSEKLSDWKKVDLSALGKVDCLTFSPASNEANAYGLLVPAYFAIDEIGLIAEK